MAKLREFSVAEMFDKMSDKDREKICVKFPKYYNKHTMINVKYDSDDLESEIYSTLMENKMRMSRDKHLRHLMMKYIAKKFDMDKMHDKYPEWYI